MPDSVLVERIAALLREHRADAGYPVVCKCGQRIDSLALWEDHWADVLLAALQPDTDTIAEAIARADGRTFGGQPYYRKLARAAVKAWMGEQ